MPHHLKAGAVSGLTTVGIALTGSGAMGINIEGTSTVSIGTNEPSMELIVSGVGSSTFEVTSSADAIAILYGYGSSEFTIGLNHLAMYVDADGYASASLGLLGNAYGTISALGYMGGDTVDDATLTPASIWSYDLRTLTVDVATKGDVYASKFI